MANPMNIRKIRTTIRDCYIRRGGFFPVLFKHNNIAYVFCRTNAGHLGRFGQITTLISTNGLDWYERGIIKKENSDVRNPSVFIFSDDELLVSAYKYNVYTKQGIAFPTLPSGSREPLLFSSKNGGKTWQEKYNAFDNVLVEIGRFSPHGQMFLYQEQLLMPIYNKQGTFLLSSSDRGKTWEVFSHISENTGAASVVVTPDNNLLAVLRTEGKHNLHGKVSLISRYVNNKWTMPVSITEQMQFPANLLTLSTGQILLTYSDRNIENQMILAKLSSDNGETWSQPIQISKTFTNCDFGYPSTIEIKTGVLLTVFYANPMQNPHFYFNNPCLYEKIEATGYYNTYPLEELLESLV